MFGPRHNEVGTLVVGTLRREYPTHPCTLTLSPKNEFTPSPQCATTKVLLNGMIRYPYIPLVTTAPLEAKGFDGWWSLVDRSIGCLRCGGHTIHLANTVPWDGAIGGRIDVILKYTEPKEKAPMRAFLKGVSPLNAAVSEFLRPLAPHPLPSLPHTSPLEPLKVILICRYQDNIHLLLLNTGGGRPCPSDEDFPIITAPCHTWHQTQTGERCGW